MDFLPFQPCKDNLPLEKTSEFEPTEENQEPEPEPCSNPDSLSATPPRISASPRQSDRLKLDADPEPPSATTTDSDFKILSSGESSEDEAYLKEAPEKVAGSPSILPSSVLDKASAIAQHFAGSVKRGSLSHDDVRSPSCASPRLPRSGGSSIINLGTEPLETLRLNSNSPDSDSAFGATDLTLLSPRSDSLFDGERGLCRRQDSTLSRQDQLLLGKIKTYYENAESKDATFRIQRRESLTYIPTGLVRSSISRLNSIPNDKTVRTNPANLAPCFSLESNSALSQSLQDNPSEDDEFRPSSEMIKIWQTMEREITGNQRSREAPRIPRMATDVGTKAANESRESGASDLSTITEESSSLSPLKLKASGVNRTRSRRQDGVKDSNQQVEVDKTKSKVLHLARQYSQRLKTCEPAVGQRSSHLLMNRKTLPCVLEERESTGTYTEKSKPSLTLPLVSDNQAPSLPLRPADKIQSVAPGLAIHPPDRARSRSPVSPISPLPPIEGFNWPDVRELRSKYSDHGRSQKSSVGRSLSIPEQMFDLGLRRHSSCSSKERRKRLHRVATGDYDGYYVAAEASLPDDPEHKIIVMEKLPEPAESKPDVKAKTEPDTTAAPSNAGQQNIVKNLREKFQSLS
uniref:Si:ch73-212j7.3 n=1 Tax=Sander lucioperca TaxID=283035 RepID=A0A8C9Z1H4_SANLU